MQRRRVVTPIRGVEPDLIDHLGGRNRVLVPAHPIRSVARTMNSADLEEVSAASHCVPSSLTNLATWGLVREYQSTKPTLAQLDGDSD